MIKSMIEYNNYLLSGTRNDQNLLPQETFLFKLKTQNKHGLWTVHADLARNTANQSQLIDQGASCNKSIRV